MEERPVEDPRKKTALSQGSLFYTWPVADTHGLTETSKVLFDDFLFLPRANLLQELTRITTSTLIASLTYFILPAFGLNLLDPIAIIVTLAI